MRCGKHVGCAACGRSAEPGGPGRAVAAAAPRDSGNAAPRRRLRALPGGTPCSRRPGRAGLTPAPSSLSVTGRPWPRSALSGGLALRACGAWAVSRGSRRRWQRGRGAWSSQHPLCGPQHLWSPQQPLRGQEWDRGRAKRAWGAREGSHGADFPSLT